MRNQQDDERPFRETLIQGALAMGPVIVGAILLLWFAGYEPARAYAPPLDTERENVLADPCIGLGR